MAQQTIPAKLFYRIKQVDNDGRYTLSSIVNISVKSGQVLQVWPTRPATSLISIFHRKWRPNDNYYFVRCEWEVVIDETGQSYPGINAVSVKDIDRLASGILFLKDICRWREPVSQGCNMIVSIEVYFLYWFKTSRAVKAPVLFEMTYFFEKYRFLHQNSSISFLVQIENVFIFAAIPEEMR